jgi:hypothetical protein
MRLQLSHGVAALAALLLALRGTVAWGQSSAKLKRLHYDEGSPGVKVDEDALEVLVQMDNEDQVNFSAIHDVVTGASPTGVPAQTTTVTGASGSSSTSGGGQKYANFNDERWAFSAGYAPLFDRTIRPKISLSYSEEKDYLSKGITLGAVFDLNKKNTTIAPSVTYFDDLVRPTNGKPDRGKTAVDSALEISQIVNSWNVASVGFAYNDSHGYLTDPYKQVLVGTSAVDESRPDTRVGSAVQAGWRTKPFDQHALDLIGRYYWDSWGIESETFAAKTLSELGESWIIELFFRYYNQNAADFWAATFAAGNNDRYRSSDLRLSPFHATTVGLTGIYKISDTWWVEGSVARYTQYAAGISTAGQGTGGGGGGEGDLYTNAEREGGEGGDGGGGGAGLGGGSGSNVSALIYSLAIQLRW